MENGNVVSMEILQILTNKQREAYLLHKEGLSYSEIGRRLGKTANAVRQHCVAAERRIKEYEAYQRTETRNNEVVSFPLTRGELKILHEGLQKLEEDALKHTHFGSKGSDWRDKLSYSDLMVQKLRERIEEELYGSTSSSFIN